MDQSEVKRQYQYKEQYLAPTIKVRLIYCMLFSLAQQNCKSRNNSTVGLFLILLKPEKRTYE